MNRPRAPWNTPPPDGAGPPNGRAAGGAPASSPQAPGLRGYLRHPTPVAPRPSGESRLQSFVRLLGLCLLVAVVTAPVSEVVSSAGGATNRLDDVAFGPIVLAGVLLAPLVEELTFRLVVAPFRAWWLVVSALGLLLVDVRVGSAAVLVAVAVALVRPLRRRLAEGWARHFPFVFYGSAVVFGLVHASNWALDRPALAVVLVPLLVLPQALIGVVLGYARVTMGLLRSMLLHAAYNGSLLLLAAALTR